MVVAEQAHQPPFAEQRRDTPLRTELQAQPGQQVGEQEVVVVAGQSRARLVDTLAGAVAFHPPEVLVQRRVLEDQPGVPLEVLRALRRGLPRQVGGAGAKHDLVRRQRPRHQPRQVDGAVAQAEVVAAFAEIEEGFVEVHPQADPRMRLEEAGAGLLEERPGLGQRQAAGGALEQAGTEFRFQVGDGLGQRRGRLAQALGATAEATGFGSGDEHRQGIQFVHRLLPFRHKCCAPRPVLPGRRFG